MPETRAWHSDVTSPLCAPPSAGPGLGVANSSGLLASRGTEGACVLRLPLDAAQGRRVESVLSLVPAVWILSFKSSIRTFKKYFVVIREQPTSTASCVCRYLFGTRAGGVHSSALRGRPWASASDQPPEARSSV